MKVLRQTIIILIAVISSGYILAQDKTVKDTVKFQPMGTPTATVFTNFHTIFSDKTTSGFDLGRAYLGYKYQFTKDISVKVIMDIGKSDDISDLQRIAYIKNAMLTWTKGGLTLNAGLTGLEQFSAQESCWGHRYIMKSFQDEYKFGSSADLGITAKYKFADWFSADVEILNGEGYKKIQMDNRLLYAVGLSFNPMKELTLRVYGDYNNKAEGDTVRKQKTNLSFFAAWQQKQFSIGAEYNMINSYKYVDNYNPSGISVYSSVQLPKHFEFFCRWDYLKSKEDWNKSKDGDMILVGLQYAPCKGVKVSPNFRLWLPSDSEKKTEPSVFLNLEIKI